MKTKILWIAFWLNRFISKSSLGNFGLVLRIQQACKKLFLGRISTDNKLILVKVAGQSMYISNQCVGMYISKPYEPFSVKLFRQALKPRAIVLDIGAHFGLYSLIASQIVGEEGNVYAFEPLPDNFAALKRNVGLSKYDNIVAVQKAVGERDEIRSFSIPLVETSGTSSFYPRSLFPVKETCSVECVAIDNFLKGQSVDVIKMDVEGNESYALKGMRQTISKSSNLVLLIEFCPAYIRQANINPDDFLMQLKDLGFKLQLIDEDRGHLTAFISDEFRKKYDDPLWYANLYCVKK